MLRAPRGPAGNPAAGSARQGHSRGRAPCSGASPPTACRNPCAPASSDRDSCSARSRRTARRGPRTPSPPSLRRSRGNRRRRRRAAWPRSPAQPDGNPAGPSTRQRRDTRRDVTSAAGPSDSPSFQLHQPYQHPPPGQVKMPPPCAVCISALVLPWMPAGMLKRSLYLAMPSRRNIFS